jgi:hypothetical protein
MGTRWLGGVKAGLLARASLAAVLPVLLAVSVGAVQPAFAADSGLAHAPAVRRLQCCGLRQRSCLALPWPPVPQL